MSWPFSASKRRSDAIDPEGGRILALALDSDDVIIGPKAHSICYGPNGTGKSTTAAVPALFSWLSSQPERGIMVLDSKSGEICAQCIEMCVRFGRKVALVDDTGILPQFEKYRISLNPFGGVVAAYKRDPRDVVFAIENITQALIEEPKDDAKNKYFRVWPRNLIEFAILVLLKRNPDEVTPGAVYVLLSDPEMLTTFAEIEAEESEGLLRAHAKAILEMRGHEHWPQHLSEALSALKIYGPGMRLHDAGRGATTTHADLIRQGYVTFVVGSQATIHRMGTHYALNIFGFTEALYSGAGSLRILADEFCNCPLGPLVTSITTLRAFGPSEVHFLTQSRSDAIRKFGEQETRTLEENCIVTQWLGFNFEEAQRVSKAMGEEHAVATSLGSDNGGFKTNTNLNLVKQPRMSVSELMAMPRGNVLLHIKGVGFVMGRSIAQNQIAPFCSEIAENHLEGGKLPPDPKITLVTP